MNKSFSAVSISVGLPANLAAECKKSVEDEASPATKREGRRVIRLRVRQSGKLHSKFAGYMAFGAAAVVSMIAAITVASHDVPLMLGGF